MSCDQRPQETFSQGQPRAKISPSFLKVAFVGYLVATVRKVAINLYLSDATEALATEALSTLCCQSLPRSVGGHCSVFTGTLHGTMWRERKDFTRRVSSPVSLYSQFTCSYFIFCFPRRRFSILGWSQASYVAENDLELLLLLLLPLECSGYRCTLSTWLMQCWQLTSGLHAC